MATMVVTKTHSVNIYSKFGLTLNSMNRCPHFLKCWVIESTAICRFRFIRWFHCFLTMNQLTPIDTPLVESVHDLCDNKDPNTGLILINTELRRFYLIDKFRDNFYLLFSREKKNNFKRNYQILGDLSPQNSWLIFNNVKLNFAMDDSVSIFWILSLHFFVSLHSHCQCIVFIAQTIQILLFSDFPQFLFVKSQIHFKMNNQPLKKKTKSPQSKRKGNPKKDANKNSGGKSVVGAKTNITKKKVQDPPKPPAPIHAASNSSAGFVTVPDIPGNVSQRNQRKKLNKLNQLNNNKQSGANTKSVINLVSPKTGIISSSAAIPMKKSNNNTNNQTKKMKQLLNLL